MFNTERETRDVSVSSHIDSSRRGSLGFAPGAVLSDTWRMAQKMPADSIEGEIIQAVADRIAERTGGKITVQVYPAEQLGKDDAILEQLQLGTVHIYPEGSSYLQKWVSEVAFTGAPFLFDDREHWAAFQNSDLVRGWMEKVEAEAGVIVIGDPTQMVRGPCRVMVTSKPVACLEDIAGLGAVEIKAMRERGYSAFLSSAITVVSAIVAPFIPPSVPPVVYAFLSNTSVARMFLAGVVPGLPIAASLMAFNRVLATRIAFPQQPRTSAREVWNHTLAGTLTLLAPAIIMGGILTGTTTACRGRRPCLWLCPAARCFLPHPQLGGTLESTD